MLHDESATFRGQRTREKNFQVSHVGQVGSTPHVFALMLRAREVNSAHEESILVLEADRGNELRVRETQGLIINRGTRAAAVRARFCVLVYVRACVFDLLLFRYQWMSGQGTKENGAEEGEEGAN